MQRVLQFFMMLFLLSFVVVTSQESKSALEQTNQLLDNYSPPEVLYEEPDLSADEAWQQKYQDQLAAASVRFVDSVIAFSSQYGTGSWAANQIIGLPNFYPGYGDNGNAWTSAGYNDKREWIELYFANPEPINNVNIYETYNPGFVDTVYVRNPNTQEWVKVWEGTAAFTGPQSRIFRVFFDTTTFMVSDVRLAINDPAVSGWNEIDAVSITIDQPPKMRVNTMPSYAKSSQYGNAIAGQAISVWGNVHNGAAPFTYKLEFGDGVIDSGTVADPHYIGADHAYTTAGTKTMKLSVWDATGKMEYDESQLKVYAVPTDQININMAIEKGLLFLYKTQYPDGYWSDGYNNTPSTGAALLSFEENGHLPTNDYDEDIYAEYVHLGLNFLLNNAVLHAITPQEAGDPDSDGDGIGAYLNANVYANGIGLLSILGGYRSGMEAMFDTISVGPFEGETYYDFIVDAIDQFAFNQTDSSSGVDRGGWRYNINTPNYGSSDNSAVQWPGLVIEAAEKSWGMSIQPWIKDELLIFLQNSQDTVGGGFGYGVISYNYWKNVAKTGSGIGSYAALDYTSSDMEIQKAIDFLDAHWNDAYDNRGYGEHFNGNLYAMYAVAKGMRITDNRVGVTNIGLRNWYNEYANHLLTNISWGQQPDGHWNNSVWFNYTGLNTAFAILILTQGVIIPPPVALIADVDNLPPGTSFQLDGASSFHQNPEQSILEWLWDFNAADGINWEDPDARGQRPTHPGFEEPGQYQITLRVRDNSNPPLYDLDNIVISVDDTTNHPPIAVAIPPGNPSYAGKVGESIFLNGSFSYDPDAPEDSVVAYNWDTNGDGIFGDAQTDTVTVMFESEHQGQVGLRVYDSKGDSSSNVAYITIVASRQDLYVSEFDLKSSSVKQGRAFAKVNTAIPIIPGDTLSVFAVLKNDNDSNTDAPEVLVRLYDEDPLTIGNRLGEDYYVELNIGNTDTVEAEIALPEELELGSRKVYIYLDPKDLYSEWDEKNNLLSFEINVVLIPAPRNLAASSNPDGIAQLSWEDRSENEDGFIIERKLESDTDFSIIDSVGGDVTSFADSSVTDSTTYFYRVQAYNSGGLSDYTNIAEVQIIITSIEKMLPKPTEFVLNQNYPNPFNPLTTIEYALPVRSLVQLSIFNLLGEKVFSSYSIMQESGYHQLQWNAGDLASGIYIYVLQADPMSTEYKKYVQHRKMILLK